MLTENDVLAGWDKPPHRDLVAMTDRLIDRHGNPSQWRFLEASCGVPFRGLIPKGWDNLLVAGPCPGFAHRAASSFRLIRAMMALREAAGLAGAIMAGRDLSTRRVPAGGLQEKLTIDDRDEFQPARPTGIRGPVSADRGRPALRPPLPLLRAYRRRMFARDG